MKLKSNHDTEFKVGDIVTFHTHLTAEPLKRVVAFTKVGMDGLGKDHFGNEDLNLYYGLKKELSRYTGSTQVTLPKNIVESKYFTTPKDDRV